MRSIFRKINLFYLVLIGMKYSFAVSLPEPPIPQEIQLNTTQTASFPKRSATIRYGGILSGRMDFIRKNNLYSIKMTINVPLNKIILISRGTIENNQLKPQQFIEKRKDKVYSSAKFDYQKQVIYYKKSENKEWKTEPMNGYTLDIVSTFWQLALDKGKVLTPLQVTDGHSTTTYQPTDISIQLSKYNSGFEKIKIHRVTFPSAKQQFGFATDYGYSPTHISLYNYELSADELTIDGISYISATRKGNK